MLSTFREILAMRLIDPGPLDHPDLRGMSLRELADLPMPRWTAEPAKGQRSRR